MKPPSRIQIGATEITVRLAPEAARDLIHTPACLDGEVVTLCDWTKPDQQRIHLTHELLHELLFQAGFTAEHDLAPREVNNELEERLCIRLSALLVDTLRRNPRLMAFLLE